MEQELAFAKQGQEGRKKETEGTYLKHHPGCHCSHQNRSLCVQRL